jgi:hypothetical protein
LRLGASTRSFRASASVAAPVGRTHPAASSRCWRSHAP